MMFALTMQAWNILFLGCTKSLLKREFGLIRSGSGDQYKKLAVCRSKTNAMSQKPMQNCM